MELLSAPLYHSNEMNRDFFDRGLTLSVPSFVLIVGLVFAVYFGMSKFVQEKQRVEGLFFRNAQNHLSALDRGFHANFETVNVLADLFRANETVDRTQFRVFARSLRLRHPAIQALEWVPRVPMAERSDFEERARETIPDFKFWDVDRPGAPPRRDVSFPVYYLDPIEGNEKALGYDPVDHPIRSDGIERAIESGRLSVSAPTPLVQDDPSRVAFLVFTPVYHGRTVAPSGEHKWTELVGLAEGVFKAGQVFESAMSGLAPAGQKVTLWDITGGNRILIHEGATVDSQTADVSWHEIECKKVYLENIHVGGRNWEVEVRPLDGVFVYDLLLPIGVGTTVAATSLLLAFGLWVLLRRFQRTQKLVQRQTEELTHRSRHDHMTGLLNRKEYDRLVTDALDLARVNGTPTTIAQFNLDRFKVVNDACGHAAGDEMLRQLAELMKSEVGAGDRLARIGGDEFGLLLPGRTVEESLETVEKLRQSIRSFKFSWMNQVLSLGASVGVGQLDEDSPSAEEVLTLVDTACAVAKEKGRDQYHVVRAGDLESERYREQMRWLSTVKAALEEDAFRLFAQPILPLPGCTGRPLTELLLRLSAEDGTTVMPESFLPAAIRFRIMNRVDRWVIERAATMIARGDLGKKALVSINVSAQSLDVEDFGDQVLSVFSQAGASLTRVCFEVTETALIWNVAHARRVIEQLRAAGAVFALDDFGSGMASFGYLKSLPVDFVKIEGSFVREMATDASSQVIVRSIVEAANAFGMKTIAEWVEDRETYDRLAALGVDYAQGFFLGRPEPVRVSKTARP